MAYLLAHQGGWDELIMFLLPIALVVATWFVLERRKGRKTPEGDPPAATADDEPANHENPPEPPSG
jgi:hypothetical protein